MMKSLIGKSLQFATVLAMLAAAACEDPQMLSQQCTSDHDCAAGTRCHQESNQCLAPVRSTRDIEVQPSNQNNQGWVAQEFIKPTLTADGKVTLQLKGSVSIQGKVYASDDPTKMVPARIVAWRESLIPGRPRVQVQTEVPKGGGKADGPGKKSSYVLWLAKGFKYSFYVAPTAPLDAKYPPLVVSNLMLSDHLKKDFVLEGTERSVQVKGSIVDATGKALKAANVTDQQGNKLSASLQVRATEMVGSNQSTIAVTDSATGAFTFRVPPGVKVPATGRVYNLHVESAPGGVPVPTVTCSNLVLGLFSGQKAVQNLGSLQLPAFLLPQVYTWRVKGKDGTPVAGAKVKAYLAFDKLPHSKGFDSCSAYYRRTAITDASGKVSMMLLPGTKAKNQGYEVTVTSPPSSRFASRLVSSMEVGSGGGVLADMVLAKRYLLSGTVVDQDGVPVKSASIVAEGIKSLVGTSRVQPATTSASSDAQGIFTLYADSGNYNLNIRPPQGAAMPSFVMRNKSVTGDVSNLLFKIPTGFVLTGSVQLAGGKPLASAKVEVYEQVYDSDKTLVATQRASRITSQDGTFHMVLPASQ